MNFKKFSRIFTALFAFAALIVSTNAAISETILEEGFESGAIPTGWTQVYESGSNNWTVQTGDYSSSGGLNSAHSGEYNAFFFSSGWNGYTTKLVTYEIDFGVYTDNPVLSFWHGQEAWAGDQDELTVYYKNSSDGDWVELAHYIESIDTWTYREISLPNVNSTYYIAFEGYQDYGYGVVVDDVEITADMSVSLDPPALLSPDNGATGESLSPSFSWRSATGADSYNFYMSENSDMSSPMVYVEGTTALTHDCSLTLKYESTYYWMVQSYNGILDEYEDSDTYSFTTMDMPQTSLLAPDDGSTVGGLTDIALMWTSVDYVDGYAVQLSDQPDFSNILYENTNVTETEVTIAGPLDYEKTYYWRVAPFTSYIPLDWNRSVEASFTTPQIPLTGVLFPIDGVGGIELTTNFQWTPIDYIDNYHFQLSTDPLFTDVIYDGEVAGTSLTPPEGTIDMYEKTYYWRVMGVTDEIAADWSRSSYWTFTTTEMPLVSPSLPADGATGESFWPQFEWDAVPYASGYAFQLASDPDFNNLLVDMTETITETSYDLPADIITQYETTFYWRVAAVSANTPDIDWTREGITAFSFTTHSIPSVDLVSPADLATNQPLEPTFDWDPVDYVSGYQLQVASDMGFSDVLYQANITSGATMKVLPGDILELYNTTYYWRVMAFSPEAAVDWDSYSHDVYGFTTLPITVPTKTSPLDGAEGVNAATTLMWEPISGVETYHVQVSSTEDFSDVVYEHTSVRGASTIVPGQTLELSTQYYWRVRSNIGEQSSEWSSVWSYTTTSISILTLAYEDQYVCQGSDVQVGDDASVTGGSGNFHFNWYPRRGLTDYNTATPTIENIQRTARLRLTVTDRESGERAFAMITINVLRAPYAYLPRYVYYRGDDGLELGDYLSVRYGDEPYTYAWTDKNGWTSSDANPVVYPETTKRYYLTVTDANGCESDESYMYVRVYGGKQAAVRSAGFATIYPNPAEESAIISASFDETASVRLTVANALGQTAYEYETETSALEHGVDLANWPSGVYFVRLTVNGETNVLRFVKK